MYFTWYVIFIHPHQNIHCIYLHVLNIFIHEKSSMNILSDDTHLWVSLNWVKEMMFTNLTCFPTGKHREGVTRAAARGTRAWECGKASFPGSVHRTGSGARIGRPGARTTEELELHGEPPQPAQTLAVLPPLQWEKHEIWQPTATKLKPSIRRVQQRLRKTT